MRRAESRIVAGPPLLALLRARRRGTQASILGARQGALPKALPGTPDLAPDIATALEAAIAAALARLALEIHP